MLVLIIVFYGPVTMKKAFKLALAFVLSILLLHATYRKTRWDPSELFHSKIKKTLKKSVKGLWQAKTTNGKS